MREASRPVETGLGSSNSETPGLGAQGLRASGPAGADGDPAPTASTERGLGELIRPVFPRNRVSNLANMAHAYARWAPFYDMLYDRALASGRKAAVAASLERGPEVLEVGVGTGLSLPIYPEGYRVTGVDLSRPMLLRAQTRISEQKLSSITGLAVMDACRLGFAAERFDTVMAQYVIALVPDAEAALDEFARVVRPGGDIVILNHLGAEGGPVALWEKAIAPIAERIGLSSAFPLRRIRNWAKDRGFLTISIESYGLFGFFTLIRLRKPERHGMDS
jgi:phosphatidylethanolamine/phosphatidyl-N-methylethanolamine N-methyltransferase